MSTFDSETLCRRSPEALEYGQAIRSNGGLWERGNEVCQFQRSVECRPRGGEAVG